MQKNVRSSNIELLRILCMLAVVACHWAAHTPWGENLTELNKQLVSVLPRGGTLAINVFVLISGYFGIYTTRSVQEKIIKLWIDRIFYSIVISGIMLLLGFEALNTRYLLRAFFPVITCRHNYITTFIILYFFIPYLNKLLRNLSKEEMRRLLFLCTIVFSVLPTIVELTELWTNNVYSYLGWMMYVYSIGAYLQLYDEWKDFPWKLICIFSLILLIWITVVIEPAGMLDREFAGKIYNIIMLIAGVSLFACFAACEIPYNRIINGIASSSFAVLLIHDDPLVRNVIWTRIFDNASYAESSNLWLYMIICVLITYFGCIIIDKVYKYFINRPIEKAIIRIVSNRNK